MAAFETSRTTASGNFIIDLVQEPAQNRRTEAISNSKSGVSFTNSHYDLQNITASCQVSQLIGGQ